MPGASRRLQDFCQVFIIGRVGMVWCWIFREVRHSLQVQVVQVKLAKPHISKYIKALGGPPIQMVRSPYQHSILGPQLWETHVHHVQHVQHKMTQNMAIMAELIRKPKQNILRTSGNPPRRVCSTRCRNFAIWSLVLEATSATSKSTSTHSHTGHMKSTNPHCLNPVETSKPTRKWSGNDVNRSCNPEN